MKNMKIYKAIVLTLIAMSIGCGKMPSGTKEDLTKLQYGLLNHSQFLQSESSPTAKANQFYLILDYWNEIKTNHKLSHSLESKVTSSMYFYKFSMIGAECFEDMNTEKERGFEEEKKQSEYWLSEAQNSYSQIDPGYWKILKQKHIERGGKERELEYLKLLSKEMINRGYSDLISMTILAGSSLDIMLEELQNTLDK